MREWLERFMMGRHGVDQFSRFLNTVSLILLVISIFIKNDIVLWVAIVVMVYSYFRILSRNSGKRFLENEKFLDIMGKITRGRYGGGYNQYGGGYNQQNTYNNRRYHQEQKNIYKYFDCPQCKQRVRVPKGKGKICITCPKCRMEFIRRS